jgi:hypothetical protein
MVAVVLVILVAGSLGVGYFVGDSNRQTITTTSTALVSTTVTVTSTTSFPTQTTATETCTTVTIPGSLAPCAAPLNYTQFQQYVGQSLSVQHQDGAIILTVGYHPCTVWFYVLPNATQVEVYLGTANATQTCE